MRQVLENLVGCLSNVIEAQTSGNRETKEHTMATGETKVEKGVDARNWRDVTQNGQENRPPDLGGFPGE